MDKFVIEGGGRLSGETEIQSAKNAVLPLLAASVLTDERVEIHKCPRIADVMNMVGILGELGCKTHFEGDTMCIDSADAANHEAYKKYQEIFDELYPATRDLVHRL